MNPNLFFRTGGVMPLTHLSFADDFIIFSNGSIRNVQKLFRFLENFQNISGLTFNKTKSSFFTAKSISTSRIHSIERKIGLMINSLPMKYLGTPLFKGRKRSFLFDDIFTTIQKKFILWAFNYLSHGGRLILIKHVLCCIPIFLLHTVASTINVSKRLEVFFNKFLWGSKAGSNTILLGSWKNCFGTMEEGKLGFKTIQDMAHTFNHKLRFNFRAKKSLWAKFMVSKYCGMKHPLNCSFKLGDSPNWKRLCNIKWEAEEFIQWGLGCGNIYFWQDK
ncbi:Putative ribonuclease H protein [Dendrobium catenatum]|uniref:Ribonuclease H protein n=1 Tax=Dendrobium catenatum TaxID=906689 RepID=A0A2I0WCT6_9ASPA|nr:Putative ribonuclease H protein [Dendrobium catenatum]